MKAFIKIRVSEDRKTALFMGIEFLLYADEGGYYIIIYKPDGTPTIHYVTF